MASVAAEQTGSGAATIARLGEENESLRRQLRHCQRLATVGTMTAMIVHEFNNILTPIINYAQLATGGDEEMVAKAIAKAADGGQRATDICDALLGLLRDQAPEPVRANLAELVEQSLLAIGRGPEKDGIKLEVTIPAGVSVMARPTELKQVIVNLVINARAAILTKGRQGGWISIVATRQDDHATLTVSDSGTGILPEHLDKLFEPFFTTKTDENNGEIGTGLGLALCKEVITRMCGDISVQSTPGEGATFLVTLPT